MMVTPNFATFLVVGGVVILIAWRSRSLTPSGALAAGVVGTAAAAAGGRYVLLLLAYFVSSTLISRLGRTRKLERTQGMVEKPGARDGWQVMSNGLVFAVAAAAHAAGATPPEALVIVATGALAASAADTWATEIGTLIGGAPRSIMTGRPLAVGASGGVTAAGLVASVAGSSFVTILALGVLNQRYLPWIAAGGVIGAIADSMAGAILQRRQWCDACGKPTEMRIHTCGSPTRRIGGLPFIENDAVNFLATLVGGISSLLLVRLSA